MTRGDRTPGRRPRLVRRRSLQLGAPCRRTCIHSSSASSRASLTRDQNKQMRKGMEKTLPD
eukprot:12895950-Prorocentrum_lima.AAC.1